MKLLRAYGRIYAESFTKTFEAIFKNLWTLLLPVGIGIALSIAASLFGSIPLIGGIFIGLALDALVSCYLYFLGRLVQGSKAKLDELKTSFLAYFWSVMNLFFVFWIGQYLVSALVGRLPNGPMLINGAYFVLAVVLNPAPEIIYQRSSYGGLETIQRSFMFLQENWIEWFIPQLFLFGIYFVISRQISNMPMLLSPMIDLLARGLLLGTLFHLFMVFRGHLFTTLNGSTHRQRIFRYGAEK